MPNRPHSNDDATAFREVVSQWQLAARTEVKRASSLPSSMFQTNDPMLEARLAESVEAMMRCLHRPDLRALAAKASGEHLAQVRESVTSQQIAPLVRRIGPAPESADIDAGLTGEYLNLLIDACSTGPDEVQAAARTLLRRDFGVDADGGLERATAELLRNLQTLTTGEGGEPTEGLEALCQRVAAAAFLAGQEAQEAKERT